MMQITNIHLNFDLFMNQTGFKLDYFNKFDQIGTRIDFWQNGILAFSDRSSHLPG